MIETIRGYETGARDRSGIVNACKFPVITGGLMHLCRLLLRRFDYCAENEKISIFLNITKSGEK
jgi:hypothetical protein